MKAAFVHILQRLQTISNVVRRDSQLVVNKAQDLCLLENCIYL